jgi:dephospho-CoA kinase
MLTIALTGGIGSGKTSVSERLAHLGVPIIDADLIARELVAPGTTALMEIKQAFGSAVVDAEGELDRPALRRLIFHDTAQRERLEEILHPKIRQQMLNRLTELTAAYAVLVIPLLAESKKDWPVDRVLLVDCPEPLQLERIRSRDKIPDQLIQQMISAQASRQQRLAIADDVIENSGDLQRLNQATDSMHDFYLKLANSQ